jgi:hypothetical protein
MTDRDDLSSMTRHWNGALAHYRQHRNAEHLEALIEEGLRYTGIQLEVDLGHSEYWAEAPLMRRVSVLLYLVDRGIVARIQERDRVRYVAHPLAERWAEGRPALAEYLPQTLELLASLRKREAGNSLETGRL